jgi:signal transduction histidine kinase
MADATIDLSILQGAEDHLREFKAGEIIFKRGDAGRELFVVRSGSVELRIGNNVLDTLSECNIFGEMALIDSAPRSATAVAVTDTTLVAVDDDKFTHLIGSFALTVMREMSRRLRNQTRESELMNIDAIIGSFIHEIRQPLTAIAANTRAAQRFLGTSRPDIEEVRLSLNRIIGVVHRTDEVLNSFRVLFQKVDRRQPANLNEIVLEVLETVGAELKDHDVTPFSELTSLMPLVAGNRAQLRQVLLNLVRNAIEAMDTIKDRKRMLRVKTETRNGDAVIVSVEDSGPGIDAKISAAIFDAFFTTKSHGMGLGLAICRMIVEHHGGQLTASSDVRSGAVFQFVLPVGSGHDVL